MSRDDEHVSPSTRPSAEAERIIPLSAKAAAIIFVFLGLAGGVVATEMASRERSSLVDAKRLASVRATELFAAYDAAALEFADATAAEEDARALASSQDVTGVRVFDADGAQVSSLGAAVRSVGFPGFVDRTRVGARSIEVARRIRALDGRVLGEAVVRVSLARENAAYVAARTRIIRAVLAGAVLLAVALALALRWLVTLPLESLVRATRRLERGADVSIVAKSRDEVGVLARAFERMASTIAERERSLREATDRLQNVLDHMGQAILVFDESGRLDTERSREAVAMIAGRSDLIADILFPADGSASVEREAFVAWCEAVFSLDAAEFADLADAAPTETHLELGNESRVYELEFRPVLRDAKVDRVMVLATNVTASRTLRADVERKDREHEKRVAAMRRLVAGGGQVFVRFLDGARFRLSACHARLAEIGATERGPVDEVFRHVHTMRGEARCFDLDRVEAILASIEFDLSDLRVRRDERYDVDATKRAVVVRLDEVKREIDAAESLFVEQSPVGAGILDQVTVSRTDLSALETLASGTGDELQVLARKLASRPFGESVFVVVESVPRWAQRAHKSVRLETEGREVPVEPGLSRLLPGVLAHLVRNAIAHGIESTEERAALGKPEVGVIRIRCEALGVDVRIDVADDGHGFDREGLEARVTPTGGTSERALHELVGHGVSTRTNADGVAGHGVGLGSVRDELAAVGYRIRIESTSGVSSRVRIEPASSEEPTR